MVTASSAAGPVDLRVPSGQPASLVGFGTKKPLGLPNLTVFDQGGRYIAALLARRQRPGSPAQARLLSAPTLTIRKLHGPPQYRVTPVSRATPCQNGIAVPSCQRSRTTRQGGQEATGSHPPQVGPGGRSFQPCPGPDHADEVFRSALNSCVGQ
jgi:hypothetical protein